MNQKLLVFSLLAAAACIACGGCSGSDRPACAPVRGEVTYLGKPVVGATVAFLCHGAPRPAMGTTDATGTYQLTTFEPDDGAVIGTHVVTVKKYAMQAEGIFPEIDPSMGAAKPWRKRSRRRRARRSRHKRKPPRAARDADKVWESGATSESAQGGRCGRERDQY